MTRSTAQRICWTTLLLFVPLLPSCSKEVIEADREQKKMESSPEFKRKQREAARKGFEGTTDTMKDFRLPRGKKEAPSGKPQQTPAPQTQETTEKQKEEEEKR